MFIDWFRFIQVLAVAQAMSLRSRKSMEDCVGGLLQLWNSMNKQWELSELSNVLTVNEVREFNGFTTIKNLPTGDHRKDYLN